MTFIPPKLKNLNPLFSKLQKEIDNAKTLYNEVKKKPKARYLKRAYLRRRILDSNGATKTQRIMWA